MSSGSVEISVPTIDLVRKTTKRSIRRSRVVRDEKLSAGKNSIPRAKYWRLYAYAAVGLFFAAAIAAARSTSSQRRERSSRHSKRRGTEAKPIGETKLKYLLGRLHATAVYGTLAQDAALTPPPVCSRFMPNNVEYHPLLPSTRVLRDHTRRKNACAHALTVMSIKQAPFFCSLG